MKKPICYLWKNDFSTQEDFEKAKERCKKLRFRVVTYLEGPKSKNIHDGLKAMIKNHYQNISS